MGVEDDCEISFELEKLPGGSYQSGSDYRYCCLPPYDQQWLDQHVEVWSGVRDVSWYSAFGLTIYFIVWYVLHSKGILPLSFLPRCNDSPQDNLNAEIARLSQ